MQLVGEDALKKLAVDLDKEIIIDDISCKAFDERCVANKAVVLFEGACHKIVAEAVDAKDEAALHLLEAIKVAMAGQPKARAPKPWRCSAGPTCSE